MREKCPSTVAFDLVVGWVCDIKCYFKITDNLIVHTTPSPASPSKYSQSNASHCRYFPYFYSPSIKKKTKLGIKPCTHLKSRQAEVCPCALFLLILFHACQKLQLLTCCSSSSFKSSKRVSECCRLKSDFLKCVRVRFTCAEQQPCQR